MTTRWWSVPELLDDGRTRVGRMVFDERTLDPDLVVVYLPARPEIPISVGQLVRRCPLGVRVQFTRAKAHESMPDSFHVTTYRVDDGTAATTEPDARFRSTMTPASLDRARAFAKETR